MDVEIHLMPFVMSDVVSFHCFLFYQCSTINRKDKYFNEFQSV
jgi:hypothetical protein